MKKWAMGAMAALVVVAMAGCGAKTTSTSASGGDGKTYKIATDASYAPMENMDKDKIVGFDVDFLAAVMKQAGLKYQLDNTGWDALFTHLDQKDYDAGISAISITDERKQKYDFSVPYYESTNMIMAKEGSPIKSASDLKDKKVAIQGGTTADELMSKIMGSTNTNLKKFDSNTLALLELDKGGVDAVVADSAVIMDYVKNNPKKKFMKIEDPTNFSSEFYGIAFPKGSELKAKLDPAIEAILKNGEYAKIYKKWFDKDPNVDHVLSAK